MKIHGSLPNSLALDKVAGRLAARQSISRMIVRTPLYRFLEMIPGGLVWLTLILAVSLSYFWPLGVIYFIVLFDLFWLFRIIYFLVFVFISTARYRRALKIDWLKVAQNDPGFDRLYHLILLPTVHEPVEVLRATLASLAAARYDVKSRFIVVIGGEERQLPGIQERADILLAEFGDTFCKLVVTIHPDGVLGEMRSKGANLNWEGRQLQPIIAAMGIANEDVVVSAFDCDTVTHPQYFSYLAHTYLTHPNRLRSSYQPVVLFNNNIWDVSPPLRLAAFSTIFWLFGELSRPEKMGTFSSHSMPWQAAIDVGFWQNDMVSEDSRIFQQCIIRYDGDYSVTPLYLPVSMDTVVGTTFWEGLVNLYKQQRRWAWGVEHFPFMITEFRKRPNMPLHKKIFYLWLQTEGMYTWAVAPLLIFILGYLPLWLAPETLKATAFFQNTPHTLEWLMRLSLSGVFVTAAMSFSLLPPRPNHKSRWDWLVMVGQWCLVPFTFIIFSAVPAIDAQTRLMLGKYLGFNVTVKVRKS